MASRLVEGGGRGPTRSAAAASRLVASRLLLPLLLLALCAVLAGCGQSPTAPPTRGVIIEGPSLTLPPLSPSAHSEATGQVADPVRVRVPAIGVDAPVRPLYVDAHGVLPPPDGDHITGWWKQGPEPGEQGPAVIAGHVDSFQGPAVFFRLPELNTGDEIFIDRVDGSTAVFATQRVERHDKEAFPTEAVYGGTPDSQLRLITCGGNFDDTDRRYLDNIIVYAVRSG